MVDSTSWFCGLLLYQLPYSLSVPGLLELSPVVIYAGSVYAVLVAQPLPVFRSTTCEDVASVEHPPLADTLYDRTTSVSPSPLRSINRTPRSYTTEADVDEPVNMLNG